MYVGGEDIFGPNISTCSSEIHDITVEHGLSVNIFSADFPWSYNK